MIKCVCLYGLEKNVIRIFGNESYLRDIVEVIWIGFGKLYIEN